MAKKPKTAKTDDHAMLLKGVAIALVLLDGLIWADRFFPASVICQQAKWGAVDVILPFGGRDGCRSQPPTWGLGQGARRSSPIQAAGEGR
jgi:hypothetical protein